MSRKLEEIRKQVLSEGEKGDIVTSIYYLAKELHCLPDLLGREYEIEYDGDKIKKIIQKPISISAMMILLDELKKDYKRQEKEMRKSKGRVGRR